MTRPEYVDETASGDSIRNALCGGPYRWPLMGGDLLKNIDRTR
jgi:hypothetical protein